MIQVVAGDAVMRPGHPEPAPAIKNGPCPWPAAQPGCGAVSPVATFQLPTPGSPAGAAGSSQSAVRGFPQSLVRLAVAGGAGCAIPPELPQCRDVPAPPAGLPAGPRTSAGSGYKAQAAEHPSPGSSPRRASSRRQPPAGAEMFYSGILTEPSRKEVEIREAASLRQQRRMKQAVQFIHKDSADLLPLDGLKKLGTSKDTVRFCCVYWK